MTPRLDEQLAATTTLVPAPSAAERAPSLVAGRYRLVQRLGSGGSADVWRAHDDELERDVAIKLLRADTVPDHATRARFVAEARAAAGLSHPGIVTVHDLLVTDGAAALVMAYVEGETLAARVKRRGALPLAEAASLGAEIADALAFAHARGLVHCDVKPGNILIDRDGHARLVDFGIARALLEADADRDRRAVMGTLRYMAPEQLAGEAVGPATDVFALGAVIHEMVSGRPPFAATTPAALVVEHRAGPPALGGVPAGLAALVRSCLAADPALRPSSMAAIARFLRGQVRAPAARPLAIRGRAPRLRLAAVGAGMLALLGAGILLAAPGARSTSNAAGISARPATTPGAAAAASHRPRTTAKPKATARPVVIVPASRVAPAPAVAGHGHGHGHGKDKGGGDGG